MINLVFSNEHYNIHENDKGQFSVYIKELDSNNTLQEYCVSQKNKSLDEAMADIKYFENSNYEDLLAKKKQHRANHAEIVRNRNLLAIKEGKHQFQLHPEIQEKATRAAVDWAIANPDKKKEITEKAANIKWSNIEHNESMYKVLRDNNISGKTAAGLHEMLNDPVKGKIFRENKSISGKVKWQDEDYRRNVINGLLDAAKRGDWIIPYKRTKKGWFYSKLNNKWFFFRSSYELLTYEYLESNENIVKYKVEDIRVEFEYEGKLHITIPDLLVEFIDGYQIVIEIKCEYYLSDPKTQAKIKAIKKYACDNNLGFLLLTEKELTELGILGDKKEEVFCL